MTPTACSCCRASCRIIGSTEHEARELARQFDELRVPEYGLWQLAGIFETDPSVFELDKPLPDFILARPKLEGAQSRSDLIIELAQRENLTVREILSRLGGGRGHFTFIGTPDQVVDTIVAWFEGGAADGFNIMARGAAVRTGDLHRARAADPATQGTVPRGLHGHHPARPLRTAGAGQPIPPRCG